MTECRGLVINIAVATCRAGICGITAVYAIGSSYYGIIAVTKRGNALLRKQYVCTNGALLTLGQAVFGTGRRLSGKDLYVMIGAKISFTHVAGVILWISINVTVCRNHVLCKEDIAAYRALATVGQAGVGTGGSLTAYSLGGVTECRYVICLVAVAAHCTGIGGIALVFTIGSGHYRAVAVT